MTTPKKELQTKKPQTIVQMLEDKAYQEKLGSVLPRVGVDAERFVRIAFQALQQNPALVKCDPKTLFGAMIASASLGLEPNTQLGHAYLIPFNISKKVNNQWVKIPSVQFIIGYKGYLALVRRSKEVENIHADVVYEGDYFSYEYGSNQHLKHIPKGSRDGRKPTHAYCHAKLVGGEAFEVLPYDEVLKIRNSSQGYSSAMKYAKPNQEVKNPWVQYEHEMASKTMVRRLVKYLPMSIEVSRAVELDAYGDHGVGDYSKFTDAADPTVVNLSTEDYESVEADEDGVVIESEQEDAKPKPTPKKATIKKATTKQDEQKQDKAEKPIIKDEPEKPIEVEEELDENAFGFGE